MYLILFFILLIPSIFLIQFIISYFSILKEYNHLKKSGIADDYLGIPKQTISKFGSKVIEPYLSITEPKYRYYNGYPPDWEWRKLIVLIRENRKCFKCNKLILLYESYHIHHIQPLSKKGNNDLNNLVCLCFNCHKNEHKYNKYFFSNQKNYLGLRNMNNRKEFEKRYFIKLRNVINKYIIIND